MKPKTSLIFFAAAMLSVICVNTALAQIVKPVRLELMPIEGAGLEPAVLDDGIDFWAELDEDGNVFMDWGKYSHAENFTYYKIVRSQENANPVYPKDGFIYYTENIDELSWTDTSVPYGTNWYRICHVADPKVYCSGEVYKIIKAMPIKTGALAEKIALTTTDLERISPEMIDPTALEPSTESTGVPDAVEASDAIKINPALRPDLIAEKIAAAEDKKNNGSIEAFFSEYWVQFLALIVSLIGVSLAVTGFTVAGAKKKKSVTKFLHQIDDTFASFKWKSKRCEAELYRLHDLIDDRLKEGKIDEGSYELLNKRIDKYLAEIKEIDNLPPHLRE